MTVIDPMNLVDPSEVFPTEVLSPQEKTALEIALAKEHDDWERALRAKYDRDDLRESLTISQHRHAAAASNALRRR